MQKEKRETKKDIKRQALIEQIRKMSVENDITQLSVREICSRLNISIGSFYHYFQDKNDVYFMLFSSIDAYIMEQDSSFQNLPTCKRLVMVGLSYINYCKDSGPALIFAVNSSDMTTSESYHAKNRPSSQLSLKLIEECKEQGVFKQNIDEKLSNHIFWTVLRGCALDWAKNGCNYNLIEFVTYTLDLFFNGLKN